MKTVPVILVRVLGVLVSLVLLADLFRTPFDWQIVALRLAVSLPLLVPWSLLKKKWSQAVVYFALWSDLLLSFGLVISYFSFARVLGPDAFPVSVAVASGAVFCICAPSLMMMRRTFSTAPEEPIQPPQTTIGSRAPDHA